MPENEPSVRLVRPVRREKPPPSTAQPEKDLFSLGSGTEEGYRRWREERDARKKDSPTVEKRLQETLPEQASPDGHVQWKAEAAAARAAFEHQWAVPLRRRVRVVLAGNGQEWEGLLLHDEDRPQKGRRGLYLRVGGKAFHSSEIQSLVRVGD